MANVQEKHAEPVDEGDHDDAVGDDGGTGGTGAAATTAQKKRAGDALRVHRPAASAVMSDMMLDAYDGMLQLAERKDAAWRATIVRVVAPSGTTARHASSRAFDAALKQRDAENAAADILRAQGGSVSRHRGTARVSSLLRDLCVSAEMRGARGTCYHCMGFSVAPDAASIEETEHFRPLSTKHLAKLHAFSFDAASHLRDAFSAGDLIVAHSYDPRHVISTWVNTQRRTPAPEPVPVPAIIHAAPTAAVDVVAPARRRAPATVPAPAGPAAFVEKKRRTVAARRELARQVALGGAVCALTQPLSAEERGGLARFPPDFAVDLEALAQRPDAANAPRATLPMCQVLLVALMADKYALQPFVRWAKRTGAALRSDTMQAMLAAWKNDPSDEDAWERTTHCAEISVAAQIVCELAACGSLVFRRAAPLICAAELAERVARIRSMPMGFGKSGNAPRTCALTGEQLDYTTPCYAIDLVLRDAPMALMEDAATANLASEMLQNVAVAAPSDDDDDGDNVSPLPDAVTLFVKTHSDGDWSLVPPAVIHEKQAKPAPPAAEDASATATPKRKRAPAKRKTPPAISADADAPPPAKRAKVVDPADEGVVVTAPAPAPDLRTIGGAATYRHELLRAAGLEHTPPPAYAQLHALLTKHSPNVSLYQGVSKAICSPMTFAEARGMIPECVPRVDERMFLFDLVDASFSAAAEEDPFDEFDELLAHSSGKLSIDPSLPSLQGLRFLKEISATLRGPKYAAKRPQPSIVDTLLQTTDATVLAEFVAKNEAFCRIFVVLDRLFCEKA